MMTTLMPRLPFSSGSLSIEEMLGFDISRDERIELFTRRLADQGQFGDGGIDAVAGDWSYDLGIGLDLVAERFSLGDIELTYPIEVALNLPDQISEGEEYTISTTPEINIDNAQLSGSSLSFGEARVDLRLSSQGAEIDNLRFFEIFGDALIDVPGKALDFPGFSETSITLGTVNAATSVSNEVADGITVEFGFPAGEDATGDPLSQNSVTSLPDISAEISDSIATITANIFEIADDIPVLRALDLFSEDFGPRTFGDFTFGAEYTLFAPLLSAGYDLVQTMSFIPDTLKSSIAIEDQTQIGELGDTFTFRAGEELIESISGLATFDLGGAIELSYALRPTGTIGAEVLSGALQLTRDGVTEELSFPPVASPSASVSPDFGTIPILSPTRLALPDNFFEPIEVGFEIPLSGNTLGFTQDFVVGTTQDSSFSFDLERTGDTSFPITVFVDGEVTTGNADFGDFEYTFSPGPNPELVIPASVSESFGDVAGPIEITLVPTGPESETVQILDGTASYLLIGDEVDDQGGAVFGDPHMLTFDNVAFDFQAAGEFVLTRANQGPEYEVQTRFTAISSAVSVAEAMATIVDGTTVSVEVNRSNGIVEIGGVLTEIASGETIAVGTGSVARNGREIMIDHGNGDFTQVDVFSTSMTVTPRPDFSSRDNGSFEGLLGNANGTPSDDFQLSDGTILSTPIPTELLYNAYSSSWTVPKADSLLPGPRETFDAPDRIVTLDSLPGELRAIAEAEVAAAGITNPILRDAAILDFALTGNVEFIEAAQLIDQEFNPIVDTVPVDPVSNPVVVLTSDNLVLDEEANGTATLTVSRGGTEGDLGVNYTIAGVGAVPASADDFVNGTISGSVVIADGDESASFIVEAANDNDDEGPETFNVSIALNPAQADDFELLVSSVRLTIEDDDEGPVINEIDGTGDRDNLVGTDGTDALRSGGGSYDEAFGGAGADQFIFGNETTNGARERDVILDYEVGVDSIVLEGTAVIGSIRETSSQVVIFFEGDRDAVYVRGDDVTIDNLTIVSDDVFAIA